MPMKERGRIDHGLRVRIEDHEIGVTADVDRSLAIERARRAGAALIQLARRSSE